MKTTIKKAVLITFVNYYSRSQSTLVIGTKNKQRAIKAVKDYEHPFQFKFKGAVILLNCEIDKEQNQISDYSFSYILEV